MTKPRTSHAGTDELAWPEPLVIDVLVECYPDLSTPAERLALARLQARALRETWAGRDRQAAAARLELIAFSASHAISAERVTRADLAVVHELAHVATSRHRASPRSATAACGQLELLLERVRSRPSSGKAAAVRQAASPAPHLPRSTRPAAAIG